MKEKVSPIQKALNVWAIILIVWSLYRANLHLPEWFDEFIAKPLIFIVPVYYYIKNIEKKNFFKSVYLKFKSLTADFFGGLIIGIIFITTITLANFVKSGKLDFISRLLSVQNVFVVSLTALATSISEEILSCGFILKRIYDDSKNIFTASFFGSILFFLLHIPILMTTAGLSGNLLLLFMATDLILGFVNAFIFLQRKSLGLPIFIHAFYIIALTLFV